MTEGHSAGREGIVVHLGRGRGDRTDYDLLAHVGYSHQNHRGCIEGHHRNASQRPLEIDHAIHGLKSKGVKEIQKGPGALLLGHVGLPGRLGVLALVDSFLPALQYHLSGLVDFLQQDLEGEAVLLDAGLDRQVGHRGLEGMQAAEFSAVTVDNVPEGDEQLLHQRVNGFRTVFSGAVADVLDLFVGLGPLRHLLGPVGQFLWALDYQKAPQSTRVHLCVLLSVVFVVNLFLVVDLDLFSFGGSDVVLLLLAVENNADVGENGNNIACLAGEAKTRADVDDDAPST